MDGTSVPSSRSRDIPVPANARVLSIFGSNRSSAMNREKGKVSGQKGGHHLDDGAR